MRITDCLCAYTSTQNTFSSSLLKISSLKRGAPVSFPPFTGERVYMREFNQCDGLPQDLRRWQATVDAMLGDVQAPGPIYIMIDQSIVCASKTHRRAGLHVDGHWIAQLGSHRHDHGPRPRGAFMHDKEALILATDVLGSVAYVGTYIGIPGLGGDCSHIDTSMLQRVNIEPGYAWLGQANELLHESIPVAMDTPRTLVRLNIPGWAPNSNTTEEAHHGQHRLS
jgi:hypothetical protein